MKQRINLAIHGGGRLDVYGPLNANRFVILLSRENFRRDDQLVERLIQSFVRRGITVARYEPEDAVTTRLIDREHFNSLPLRMRQGLKALLLLFFPLSWRHYSLRYRDRAHSIDYRTRSLRALIDFLGPRKEISLVTRSASGRVASGIADDIGISRLVCLGYPFRHPTEPLDSSRYSHLTHLKTPFLILQGTRDTYGGIASDGCYALAPNTSLRWIDTDHNFAVSDEVWNTLSAEIADFILKPSPSAP
jgi:predicted alpha/beta-hydrolase family hydrolase